MGWTLGVTMDNQWAISAAPWSDYIPDEKWLSGDRMNGVWYGTIEDASAHQHAMSCAPYGEYEARRFTAHLGAPWRTRHLYHLRHAGQMITFMNGLQYTGYKYSFSCVGESACLIRGVTLAPVSLRYRYLVTQKESLAGCRMTRC